MVIAIDIGGSKIRIAYVYGKSVKNKIVANTPQDKKKLIQKIIELIYKFNKREKICVGLAGFVKNGRVINTPNLALGKFDLKNFLEKKFGSKVYVENDSRCAGLAEKHYGFGRKKKNFVFLTIGTGIGGAIFLNGKLYIGKGFAGEFGHMTIKDGEFESLASGKAFERMTKKNKIGYKKIIDKVSDRLAEGLNNLIYVLDPEIIILGGGFSEVKIIYPLIRKKICSKDIIHRKIQLLPSKLGSNAGLIGAAILDRARFRD